MASLHITLPLNFNKHKTLPQPHPNTPHNPKPHSAAVVFLRLRRHLSAAAYKVIVEHEGGATELEVEADETILSKALDAGVEVPHDCKLGVCMTCPARLVEGEVDQSEGMLSEDVVERGYALMCASYPRSDCRVKIIPEEELLSLQLATAND